MRLPRNIDRRFNQLYLNIAGPHFNLYFLNYFPPNLSVNSILSKYLNFEQHFRKGVLIIYAKGKLFSPFQHCIKFNSYHTSVLYYIAYRHFYVPNSSNLSKVIPLAESAASSCYENLLSLTIWYMYNARHAFIFEI